VYERIGETCPPPGELAHLQFEPLAVRCRLILPVCLHALDFLAEVGPLLGVELAGEKKRTDPPFGGFLPHARYLTGWRVAAVVGVALLRLADQGVAAGLAAHRAPEKEVVLLGPCRELAVQYPLHLIEERFSDERIMSAVVGLLAALHPDEPDVEGIAKHGRKAVYRDLPAPAIREPRPAQLRLERVQVVSAGRVQLEGPAYQGTLHRIDGLGLPGSAIEVPDRRRQGQDALLQAAVDALQGLLAEIPDVVGGDDRLEVGGEPAAAIREVELLVREVELYEAPVHEFREIYPIPAVPDAPVDLVDHNPGGALLPEEPEHLVPDRPAGLGSRLPFLKPARDR